MEKKFKISKQLNSIIIINSNVHMFCKISDIIFIKSEKEYIRIYHPNESCLIFGSLNKLIKDLPQYFIKSHKSYIINVKKIREIRPFNKNRYSVIMMNNIEIPLTKSAFSKINDLFQ